MPWKGFLGSAAALLKLAGVAGSYFEPAINKIQGCWPSRVGKTLMVMALRVGVTSACALSPVPCKLSIEATLWGHLGTGHESGPPKQGLAVACFGSNHVPDETRGTESAQFCSSCAESFEGRHMACLHRCVHTGFAYIPGNPNSFLLSESGLLGRACACYCREYSDMLWLTACSALLSGVSSSERPAAGMLSPRHLLPSHIC